MISGGCVTTKVKRGLLNGYEFQIIMKWKKVKNCFVVFYK